MNMLAMPVYPKSVVIGTWRVARSTQPLDVERYLHFSEGGEHVWEHANPEAEGVPPLVCFRYHMTRNGVFLTPAAGQSKGWECRFEQDGEFLVFSNDSGRKWWMERVPASERPVFLTRYYPPPDAGNPFHGERTFCPPA